MFPKPKSIALQWLHDLRRSVQSRKAQRFFASAQVGLINGDQASA